MVKTNGQIPNTQIVYGDTHGPVDEGRARDIASSALTARLKKR